MSIRFMLCPLVLACTAASSQSPETTVLLRHNPIYAGTERYFLQEVHADIMGRGAGAAVALVVGAVEILDLRIALIEVKVKVAAAIDTDQ